MQAGWVFTDAAAKAIRAERVAVEATIAAITSPATRPVVLIWATMADGAIVTDLARDFGEFLDAVLSFRRDPDVASVRWTATRPADVTKRAAQAA